MCAALKTYVEGGVQKEGSANLVECPRLLAGPIPLLLGFLRIRHDLLDIKVLFVYPVLGVCVVVLKDPVFVPLDASSRSHVLEQIVPSAERIHALAHERWIRKLYCQ